MAAATIKIAVLLPPGQRPDLDHLQQLYSDYSPQQDFSAQLLKVLRVPATEVSTSWLLHRYLAEGQQLSARQTAEFIASLHYLQSWQACLNALQSIQYLRIAASDKHKLEAFSREKLSSNNKFERAWAYDAFYRLAVQHAEFMPAAQQFLTLGLRDEPASVKARIRRLLG